MIIIGWIAALCFWFIWVPHDSANAKSAPKKDRGNISFFGWDYW